LADTTFLQADLRERPFTDILISPWLLLAMVGLWPVAFAVMFVGLLASTLGEETEEIAAAGGMALFAILALASWALFIYITYQLVSRRDRHFRRLARLAEDAAVYLRARAAESGRNLEAGLARLEAAHRATREQAGERGAVIWTILCALAGGIVYLVLWYVLMDDYKRHEINEVELAAAINAAFSELGVGAGIASQRQIPERSFWLYLFLSLITLSVFGLYWTYVMIADPNQHFRAHVEWESRLAQVAQ